MVKCLIAEEPISDVARKERKEAYAKVWNRYVQETQQLDTLVQNFWNACSQAKKKKEVDTGVTNSIYGIYTGGDKEDKDSVQRINSIAKAKYDLNAFINQTNIAEAAQALTEVPVPAQTPGTTPASTPAQAPGTNQAPLPVPASTPTDSTETPSAPIGPEDVAVDVGVLNQKQNSDPTQNISPLYANPEPKSNGGKRKTKRYKSNKK